MTAQAMFPLGTVLLPHMPLPLRIFEPRYLVMLADILQFDVPSFGVVLIERGQEVGGEESRFDVGTIAEVADLESDETGVLMIAQGARRFTVEQWEDDDPYPRAHVRVLPELEWSESHRPLLESTERVVRRAVARATEFADQPWAPDVELATDPLERSWQIAGIAPLGDLDRVTLLRATSVPELLTTVLALVAEAEHGRV